METIQHKITNLIKADDGYINAYPYAYELAGKILNLTEKERGQVEQQVMPVACGHWQKEKPKKECYFVYRDNEGDNYPSLYEAKLDDNILCVFNIQDDEFIYTMEEMADGEFFIIEKESKPSA